MKAVERIVVQTTRQEKQAILDKARQLKMSVSELMRSGASAYQPAEHDLLALASAAQASAKRSMAAIDEALADMAASSARIEAMEAQAKASRHPAPTRPSAACVRGNGRIADDMECAYLDHSKGRPRNPTGAGKPRPAGDSEDLTARVIRLEAQLDMVLMGAGAKAGAPKRLR